jgi:uncharacterized damage-inducible protein DinB
MTDRLPAIDLPNMVAALRSERTEMLDFTRSLTDDEWRAPSAAAGWSIADVVGHIAATAHNFYAPFWRSCGLRISRPRTSAPLNDAAAGSVSG